MTRRLIASTVLTVSRGGDPAASDRLGFVGRYRAGADFLAEAGYVDKDKFDQAMGGHRSELAWARTGGMATFLEDASNWKGGLALETYKLSPDRQDLAFKLNAENDYSRAREQGFIGEDEKPGRVAGFLKAAHIVGFNSAREAMTGGRVYRDFNGVSNYAPIHDISRNGDGLDALMALSLATRMSVSNVGPLSVARTDHPEHGRWRDMYTALGYVPGLSSDQERQQAAASILVATRAADMQRVDHLVPGPSGTVFAVQGDLSDPSHRLVPLKLAELASQPLERSTAPLAALGAQPDQAGDGQRQERTRGV